MWPVIEIRMKSFLIFLCLTWCQVFAQTLDTYGGLLSVTCPGGAASHFYTQKIGNRWWLCTPLGHGYFYQSVGGAGATPSNIVAKYGSKDIWAVNQVSFLKSVGFNGVGELSDDSLLATYANQTNKVPFIGTFNVSQYSTTNLSSYGPHPVKNFLWGVNGYFTAYRGAGCIDAFDTGYPTFANAYFAGDAGFSLYTASPYFIGLMGDDTDFVCGLGAGPDNNTTPSGTFKTNLAFAAMISSPVQTFNAGFSYQSTPVQYADTKVYSKTSMASPPTTCSISTPCSLRDYLAKRYTTIAALNTAWGTGGYYSTFDSAGTAISSESCGTGNGATTIFNCTLAHSSISPFSVSLSVAGTLQGGDCPWAVAACNIGGQVTTPYTCATIGNCVGSFNGSSGTNISSGTAAPWIQDVQVTEADCGACGLPQASYWLKTAWHGCPSPTTSREVGVTYATGAPQVTVSTQNGAADNPGCATGVDIYMSCRVVSGAATHGCASAASGQPVEKLQASNVAYPSGSWVEPTTGLVSGAALPGPESYIDYGAGTVKITFNTAPTTGQAIAIGYTYGGWMFGTGLMDEDGRNTSWVGTNPICLLATVSGGPGSQGYTCDGVINPAANMNQTMATDLDAWQAQYAGRYFSTVNSAIKATSPNTLYLGCDTLGDWDGPPRKAILQGASPYLDGAFWLWYANQDNNTDANAKYSYFSQYFGDKPIINFMTLHAQPDSAMAGNGASGCCFGLTTQPLRGQQWYTILNKELNTLSYNSTYQFVGAVWWGLYDFNNENINWGLRTVTDNAYNAHDAVSGTVACSAPLSSFTCGSEPAPGGGAVRPFGDLFGGANGITAANALWLGSSTVFTGSAITNSYVSGMTIK